MSQNEASDVGAKVRAIFERVGPVQDTIVGGKDYSFPSPSRFKTKREASAALKKIHDIRKELRRLKTALWDVPDELTREAPIKHQDAVHMHEMLKDIAADIDFEMNLFGKTGRGRNIRAYYVADQVAGHFVRAKLKRPTIGHRDGKPSTLFTKMVNDIFQVLGIESGFRNPCKAARDKITDEDIQDARMLQRLQNAIAQRAASGQATRPTPLGSAMKAGTTQET